MVEVIIDVTEIDFEIHLSKMLHFLPQVTDNDFDYPDDSALSSDVAGIINDGANSAFVLGMNDAMFIGTFIVGGTALFALIFLPRHIQRHD
jgi:hypothetical protein